MDSKHIKFDKNQQNLTNEKCHPILNFHVSYYDTLASSVLFRHMPHILPKSHVPS